MMRFITAVSRSSLLLLALAVVVALVVMLVLSVVLLVVLWKFLRVVLGKLRTVFAGAQARPV